jgi:hypothetical protein
MTIVAIIGYGQFLVGGKDGITIIIDILKILVADKNGGRSISVLLLLG